MIITHCEIFSYSLPLRQPLKLKNQTITHRDGLLIKLTDSNGNKAWGEASPLAGFSPESLDDVTSQLCSCFPQILESNMPSEPGRLDGCFKQWLGKYELSASARFGIEMAILNLDAAAKNILLSRLLSSEASLQVYLNSLIIAGSNKAVEAARKLRGSTYRAVKLKVGRASLEDDIAMVKTVSDELQGGPTLRLDANRAWSFDDAIMFAEGIAGCDIEYIEEPLADYTRLKEFKNKSGLPPSLRLAIDESLVESDAYELLSPEIIDAVILKPTMLGGLEKTAMIAREARSQGIKAVISSAYESPLALITLMHFAAAYCEDGLPVGLDTMNVFCNDLLKEPIEFKNGCIDLEQFPTGSMIDIDETMVTPISEFTIDG